jgi:hypothetical protein
MSIIDREKADEYEVRNKPYKEDSTDGRSLIRPLRYKGDVLTQVWIDARVLATLNNWLDSIGEYPKTLSELCRRPLELLVEVAIKSGVNLVENTAEARDMLSRRFRVNLNRGDRGKKNILHNQILTDIRSTIVNKITEERGGEIRYWRDDRNPNLLMQEEGSVQTTNIERMKEIREALKRVDEGEVRVLTQEDVERNSRDIQELIDKVNRGKKVE